MEAIKINIEIDPKDLEDLSSQPEKHMSKGSHHQHFSLDGGKFEECVNVMASESTIRNVLRETSREISMAVNNILEDVSLREDKRLMNTAQAHAIGKVMKEWRDFVKELASFEKRFK